ncbi:unnamed protein product [Acanthoscelides obtectus]|uniref:Peptidase M24 domain-containing protein n=1 Tax=Acanthoscelides obtectus TaxID=200917 RepID=A0A9P0KHC0_ACAOB|nr:unnamed protein product [Acanthoscelides obtectus]CAK1672607.1 Methionine aminopeptidase 1D, mitochondrial [Acanthoscelides obtectus]
MTTSKMYLNINRTFRNIFGQKTKQNFGKYNIVKPGKVSTQMTVPDHIPKPSYYLTGEPTELISCEEIKNTEQISKMRDSCQLAARILNEVEGYIQVGKTTDEIDKLVFSSCVENNAYPSPLNYKHFPKSVCTSVNNVACHGIPDDRPLQDGDIVNVDITVIISYFLRKYLFHNSNIHLQKMF